MDAAFLDDVVPGLLDLVDVGHVRHAATGGEVGKNDRRPIVGKDVRRLGHEVHAAEDDVLRLLLRGATCKARLSPVKSANRITSSCW